MTILAKVKIGSEFRVTFPKDVRDFLDLNEGDELVFYTIKDEKGRICFRKI